MYPRTNYEMTEDQLKTLLAACEPTPAVMLLGSYIPTGPQENANRAWQALGKEMGFDYMTVRPIVGKGQTFFSAVPSETELQRAQRLTLEAEEKRVSEIGKLEGEIAERQKRLENLRTLKV